EEGIKGRGHGWGGGVRAGVGEGSEGREATEPSPQITVCCGGARRTDQLLRGPDRAEHRPPSARARQESCAPGPVWATGSLQKDQRSKSPLPWVLCWDSGACTPGAGGAGVTPTSTGPQRRPGGSTLSSRKELTAEARELKGELYCLPCHDKMGVPICGACRRPIEGRVVNALGKQWHVEHFVCAKCEKPFLGHRHYEKKGLAYCETHYNQLFGDVCYNCGRVIEGDVVSALNKAWCVNCFSCSTCNGKLTLKNKFVEFDMKPVCKRCYEKFPLELKKRLKKLSELAARKAHPKSVGLNSA
uniref:LIM zinc finger domain containing 2 n=1 Tax=Equus caballus TaxID=9796 RepID=A0A3Q2IDC5_HORSE